MCSPRAGPSTSWSGPRAPGKTRTVATLAEVWHEAGVGRVIGLTTSTNAAHTLAAEGLAESYNLATFLGRIKDSDQTRGHLPVRPGDLLVVDEASMVSDRRPGRRRGDRHPVGREDPADRRHRAAVRAGGGRGDAAARR